MGTPVARKADDTAGGIVIEGRLSVIVNDRPIATRSDMIQPHGAGAHGGPVITGHALTVFAEDQEVARQGDPASCGHTLGPGSENVCAE